MNVDFLTDYIVLVAFTVCLGIGYILKQWDKIPNKIIVPTLAIIGVVINSWSCQWTITPDILCGGLISGIAASGGYEYFKKYLNNKESEVK